MNHFVHNLVVPVTVAFAVGIGSSYINNMIMMSVFREKLENLEYGFKSHDGIIKNVVNKHGLELAKLEIQIIGVNEKLDLIQKRTESRYTKEDAERDFRDIRKDLKYHAH